ncbi:hypothetical protein C8Q76DRAFT_800957 [Earliella scabrosa]|nr:hypothetical protein C8Q76DRAFT_800957 [Earliella scabrosa]
MATMIIAPAFSKRQPAPRRASSLLLSNKAKDDVVNVPPSLRTRAILSILTHHEPLNSISSESRAYALKTVNRTSKPPRVKAAIPHPSRERCRPRPPPPNNAIGAVIKYEKRRDEALIFGIRLRSKPPSLPRIDEHMTYPPPPPAPMHPMVRTKARRPRPRSREIENQSPTGTARASLQLPSTKICAVGAGYCGIPRDVLVPFHRQ